MDTFKLRIDGERIGGDAETSATLKLSVNTGTIKAADVDKFLFPHPGARSPQQITLPIDIDLPTDVPSGSGGVSTTISYKVVVETDYGGKVSGSFAAQAAGSTHPLTDLAETVIVPVADQQRLRNETEALRDEADESAGLAEGFANDAEDAVASVQRDQPNGVAPLDEDGRLPDENVPARLEAAALSTTFAQRWQPTTAYLTNTVVMAPDGQIIKRITSGTSRASYDATEQALWTVVAGGGGAGAGAVLSDDIRYIVVTEEAGTDPETLYITPQLLGGASGLLGKHTYNPAVMAAYTRTGATTFADVDAANAFVTFTAPDSGDVIIIATAHAFVDTAGNQHLWNLRDATGDITGTEVLATRAGASNSSCPMKRWHLTGLTGGEQYTIKLGFAVSTSARTATVEAGGTAGTCRGPLIMEAWAA